MISERGFAVEVVRRLRSAGHEALFAGGCVRDELLGRPPKDFDVATAAPPERVRSVFQRTIAVGAAFGVIEVLGPRTSAGHIRVQVATFRSDGAYTDGRHPDAVTYGSAREDALRRDFTINGMFYDPITEEVIDYVGGRTDLNARILRAIGSATERFGEDRLRLLRAPRFAARFNLTIEPHTATAVRTHAAALTAVSPERIADELRKLLTDPTRVTGLRLLDDLGLVPPALPEIAAFVGTPTWAERLRVLGALPAGVRFPLALAGVLAPVGAAAALACAERLKLSNAERDRTAWLIEHLPNLRVPQSLPLHQIKPTLAHPASDDLLALLRAHAHALGQPTSAVDWCVAMLAQWQQAGTLNPPPLLSGHDLQARGLPAGPHYKIILQRVRCAQLDGQVTTRTEAHELVAQLLDEVRPA
jgi:poly(A) polymerase